MDKLIIGLGGVGVVLIAVRWIGISGLEVIGLILIVLAGIIVTVTSKPFTH